MKKEIKTEIGTFMPHAGICILQQSPEEMFLVIQSPDGRLFSSVLCEIRQDIEDWFPRDQSARVRTTLRETKS
jgi:hypothetical protein